MSWQPLFFPALVALIWVVVPGLIVNFSLKLRPLTAYLFAPLVSIGIIALSAIIAPFTGLKWGPIPPIVLTVILAVAGAVSSRHPRSPFRLNTRPKNNIRAMFLRTPTSIPALAAITLVGTALLMIRHVRNFLGSPFAFSQTYDAVFHLNAVRWMIQTRNGSSLNLLAMTSAKWEPQFYPAAWHDLASLIGLTTHHSDVALATNASILATFTVIWPASMLALVYALTPGKYLRYAILPAGVIMAGIPAFPFSLADWGVLYPNLLGLCLAPAMIALFLAFIGKAGRFGLRISSIVPLAIIGGAGTALAHPTGALLVIASSAVIAMLNIGDQLSHRRSRSRILLAVALFIALVGAAIAAWIVIRPKGHAPDIWPPMTDYIGSLGTVIIHWSVDNIPQWAVLCFVIVGVIAAFRTRSYVPLSLWVMSVFFWVVASAVPGGPFRSAIVGIWYSDPHRLYAQMGLFLVPFAALGTAYIGRTLHTSFFRGYGKRRAVPLISGVISIGLIAMTQAGPAMDSNMDKVQESYTLTADANSINPQEYAFIKELPQFVPAGAKIFAVPSHGEALTYAFTGLNISTHHILEYDPPSEKFLMRHLNEMDSNPAVCKAIKDQGFGYVVYFSGPTIDSFALRTPGLTHLNRVEGLTLVHHRGNAYLYRIDRCNG